MVQQCSENQYLWEHFTVYVCVERLNSFGLFCVKFFLSSPVGRCQMFVVCVCSIESVMITRRTWLVFLFTT
jgi:hypothetical protein